MSLRRSLALAATGKKAFEFFRLYGAAGSCVYDGETTKGIAIDALLKRILYLVNFYQASAAQREMMMACLDRLINTTIEPSFESGTYLIGGTRRAVRTASETDSSISSEQNLVSHTGFNKAVTAVSSNKVNIGEIDLGNNMSSSSNLMTKSEGEYSGTFSTGRIDTNSLGHDSQAITKRLNDLNDQAKRGRVELAKTSEGRAKLEKLEAIQSNFNSQNFTESPVKLKVLKGDNKSEFVPTPSLNNSTSTVSSIDSKREMNQVDLDKYKNLAAYNGNLNLDSKKSLSNASSEAVSASSSAEGLTGLNSQDTYLVNEGLRRNMHRYRSVPGDENDSLFKIMTKAYFRIAYPIIFKKEEKK